MCRPAAASQSGQAAPFVNGDAAQSAPGGRLRVCADPNNLPFSNRRLQGFENRIAALLARDLGATLQYVWWPQRRGFVRRTLDAGRCDVVMGVPAGFEQTLTTRPYYRSTYVFVSRLRGGPVVRSFDDPALRALRIGVHYTGGGDPPPVAALARRGLSRTLVGYSIFGDYRSPNPPARLIQAVARGDVDIAVAWGPLAGWFARHSKVPLRVIPVPASEAPSGAPMTFAIAVGVRRRDSIRRDQVQRALDHQAAGVRRILRRYGVPTVSEPIDVETP